MVSGHVQMLDTYMQNIQFNFPVIYLDKHDYKISVRMINIESTKPIKSQIFSLHTTAIDMNALNPKQEIYNFRSDGSYYAFAEPVVPREYKIQLKEIHTADFKLSCTEQVDSEVYDKTEKRTYDFMFIPNCGFLNSTIVK